MYTYACMYESVSMSVIGTVQGLLIFIGTLIDSAE